MRTLDYSVADSSVTGAQFYGICEFCMLKGEFQIPAVFVREVAGLNLINQCTGIALIPQILLE